MSAAPSYDAVIGLETHVQLGTRTKMFCACRNLYGAPPNTLTCPVCTGMPGALPVANREAFDLAIRVGLALGARIARHTRFDRKNYFYPDLPKGYQISQLDEPIVTAASLTLSGGREVRINRAHLEEDSGKGLHREGSPYTLIDLNRCGIPLLEIVTEPDLRTASEAHEYLTRLRLLMRHLRVSDCDMEKGSLRCDVNVSLRPVGREALGVRTEIKNLNSLRSVEKAIEHEIRRQGRLLDAGGDVIQATLLWDDALEVTRIMRTKEESADYRYFPDPDLPPHQVSESWIESVRESLPELPFDRERRYRDELGLSSYDAGVLIQEPSVADFFDGVVALGTDPKSAANWITGDLFGLMKGGEGLENSRITAAAMAKLIALIAAGTINISAGRQVLSALFESGGDPESLVEQLGLAQLSDRNALVTIVREALAANPKALNDLRAGKKKAAGAIVGYVMKQTRGRANPAMVNDILNQLLA